MKYSEIKLSRIKGVKDLHIVNWKILMKVAKKDKQVESVPCSWVRKKLILLSCLLYSKPSIDSVQTLLKYQQVFFPQK